MMRATTNNRLHYGQIADLLDYPSAAFGTQLGRTCETCRATKAAGSLADFEHAMRLISIGEIEELYSRTFDLNPLCAPAASVHLFGEESFKRAELMARLVDAYAQAQFDCGPEVPDHVATLLRFMEVAPEDLRAELDQYILRPALRKMDEFLSSKHNPYAKVLMAAIALLQTEFGREIINA